MSTLTSPLAELIDGQLAQPNPEARAAFLRQRGRYDIETLVELGEGLPTPLLTVGRISYWWASAEFDMLEMIDNDASPC